MRDTIDMAREAGFHYPVPADGYMGLAYDRREGKETGGSLKAFEALVRANEREACAKVCDHAFADRIFTAHNAGVVAMAVSRCVTAIRARGNI